MRRAWQAARAELPGGLLAAALSVACTVVWQRLLPTADLRCCDASQYLAMARDPTSAVPTPYSYRVLVPGLVHALGTEPVATFKLLSLGCLTASGVLVYLFLRRLTIRGDLALLAMLVLLCSRGWTFYAYDPWLSDPAAFLLLSAAFLVLGRDLARLASSAVLLGVCAATRDLTVGFLLPAYAHLRRRLVDLPAAALAAAVVTPAVVVYWHLLVSAPHTGLDGIAATVRATIPAVYRQRIAHRAGFWVADTFALSLGLWWPLALASWRDPRVRWLRWWLLPVFAQLALGGDWSRFALYAFPFVLPGGAITIANARQPRALVALATVQLGVPLLDLGHPTLNSPGASLGASLLLMVVATVTLAADRWPARSAPLIGPADASADAAPQPSDYW